MKTERNILTAFILNLAFSVFELVGGMLTGSVAIVSDAVHDAGDAASIGISYFLEKKSKQQPDETYTYGYARYSIVGGLITTLILLVGSVIMICHAVSRMITPTEVNYNGMIVFAVVGVCVNVFAAFFTRKGDSLNQKAVNLHMLEDVLGWVVVLVGAVAMRFTDFSLLDPMMSIGVSVFILTTAVGNLKKMMDLFLEKTPRGVDMSKIKQHIGALEGVRDVHHVHIWSMDGQSNYATMHVVTDREPYVIKEEIREELHKHGIGHVTLEIEVSTEPCREKQCHTAPPSPWARGQHHSHPH